MAMLNNQMVFDMFLASEPTPKEQALEYYAGALLGDVPEKHKIYSNRQGSPAMVRNCCSILNPSTSIYIHLHPSGWYYPLIN